jgi:hypothetical protein
MFKTIIKLTLGYYTGYLLGWIGFFMILAVIGGML